jgi:hypothetical protein
MAPSSSLDHSYSWGVGRLEWHCFGEIALGDADGIDDHEPILCRRVRRDALQVVRAAASEHRRPFICSK